MIDGKILAAVMASLTAVAVAVGGGDLSMDRVGESSLSAPGDLSFNEVMPDSDLLQNFLESPEPENDLEAVLVAENLEGEELGLTETEVRFPDLRSIDLAVNRIESSSDIVLHDFTGSIEPGNITYVRGRSTSLTTNEVNISGGAQVDEEIDVEKIELEDMQGSNIDLDNTIVDVKTEGDDYTANTPRRVTVNSFSGDMTIYTSNSTMFLDGKVHRMESGEFSFGS